jgi:hypothetical protein
MPRALPELRLAFAMGGGVSLGVFSGSALGETLKMAVLTTTTFNNVAPTFSRVVVDSFSGASAGSLTLGLMLRALCGQLTFAPPDMEPWRTLLARAAQRNITGSAWDRAAHIALSDELGEAFITSLKATQPECYVDLIAAQRVQHTQEAVWRDTVTLDVLLRGTSDETLAGLFNRQSVDALTDSVLAFPAHMTFDGRRLLGERVLYACTLGRMLPRIDDARGEFGDDQATRLAMSDGMMTVDHSDVRIFDLRFGAQAARTQAVETADPARWVRARDGDEIPGYVASMRSPGFWRKVRATAVASGCVPFAFEPVVLNRKWYELAPGKGANATWPDPDAPAALDPAARVHSYDVCYDGGTFNNEPIREAFRLAGFHDATGSGGGAGGASTDFVRRVVFVDPNAIENTISKEVRIQRRWQNLEDGHAGRCTTGDRLLAHAPALIGAIWAQARIVEGDRIAATRKRFAERAQLRERFAQMGVTLGSTPSALADFAQDLHRQIITLRREALLPPAGLDFTLELARVISEEASGPLAVLAGIPRDSYPRTRADWEATVHPEHWALTLLYLQLDITLDLVGKHSESKLVGICPIDPAQIANGTLAPFELAGSHLFAFSGFCSHESRRFNAVMGRLCARYFISLDTAADARGYPGMGAAAATMRVNWPTDLAAVRAQDLADLKKSIPALKSRLQSIADNITRISERNFIVRGIFSRIAETLIEAIITADPPQPTHFHFVLLLPGPGYTLSKPGPLNDLDSHFENGRMVVRTCAARTPDITKPQNAWNGPHVYTTAGASHLSLERPGGQGKLRIDLPHTPRGEEYPRWEATTLASDTCIEFQAELRVDGTVTPWKIVSANDCDDVIRV